MDTVTFQASPRGKKVGFIVASDGTRQLMVAVLPKLWRGRQPRYVRVDWEPDASSRLLTLYEGDTCTIAGAADVLAVVEEMLREASRNATGPDDAATHLVEPAVRMDASLERGEDVRGPSEIYALFELTGLGHIFPTRRIVQLGQPEALRFFREWLFHQFVSEVAVNLHQVRRGYRTVTAELDAVRGRIKETGVVTHLATGLPRVLCEFDEFTHDVPLYRVLATALEVVASSPRSTSRLADALASTQPQIHAIELRRALASITAYRTTEALAQLANIRLTPMTACWKPALDLAELVLRGESLSPERISDATMTAFEIAVSTDKVWEKVVLEALKMATARANGVLVEDGNASGKTRVPPPWDIEGNEAGSYPDVLLHLETHGPSPKLWSIDAKYKFLDHGQAPQRADLYQMFAYSHLTTPAGGDKAGQCALVYPSGDGAAQLVGRYLRQPDESARATLFVSTVRFVSADAIVSEDKWRRYLLRTGQALLEHWRLERFGLPSNLTRRLAH